MNHAIRQHAHDDDAEGQDLEVLLKLQVPIQGDEDLAYPIGATQQFSILDAG